MKAKRTTQTEAATEAYNFVLGTAKAKGLTLEAATREAIRRWAAGEGDLSWDPLFDPNWVFEGRVRTDASKVNEVLYRRRKR